MIAKHFFINLSNFTQCAKIKIEKKGNRKILL